MCICVCACACVCASVNGKRMQKAFDSFDVVQLKPKTRGWWFWASTTVLDVEAATTEPQEPPAQEVGVLRHTHKKGTGNRGY